MPQFSSFFAISFQDPHLGLLKSLKVRRVTYNQFNKNDQLGK
jgi:hypothetical protein